MKEFIINEQQIQQIFNVVGEAQGKIAVPVIDILRSLKQFVNKETSENQEVSENKE